MAGGHDPGRAVDRGPVVVGAVARRFADVSPIRTRIGRPPASSGDEGALGGEARRDAVARRAEHRHHAVARRLDDPAAGLVDRRPRIASWRRERLAHRVRCSLPGRVLPSTSVNRNASIRALVVRSSSIQRSPHIEPVDPGVSSVPSIPSGARDTALEHASLDALTLRVADCYDARVVG